MDVQFGHTRCFQCGLCIVNYYTSSDSNAQFSILCSDVLITLWYTLAKCRYAISSLGNDNGQIRFGHDHNRKLGFYIDPVRILCSKVCVQYKSIKLQQFIFCFLSIKPCLL